MADQPASRKPGVIYDPQVPEYWDIVPKGLGAAQPSPQNSAIAAEQLRKRKAAQKQRRQQQEMAEAFAELAAGAQGYNPYSRPISNVKDAWQYKADAFPEAVRPYLRDYQRASGGDQGFEFMGYNTPQNLSPRAQALLQHLLETRRQELEQAQRPFSPPEG